MRVLVLNPGSATLKAAVIDLPRHDVLYERTLTWSTVADDADHRIAASVGEVVTEAAHDRSRLGVDAVGYRVVHGATRFVGPTLIDDQVVTGIESLAELAPLHNPAAASTIRAARRLLPDIPHVAAFDTAFHASLPEGAIRYPIPDSWLGDTRIRRYGFHGLSVEWSTRRAAVLLGRPVDDLRLVVAHLGGGCSVTAVDGGRSVDTSMGMTPLEGLMMGTRAGSIDPGIILRRIEGGRSVAGVRADLDQRSGLVAVGGTSDMQELLKLEDQAEPRATLAIDMFVRRAAAGIAASATNLPSVDGMIFTGGIGQHAVSIVDRIVDRLHMHGLRTAEQHVEGDLILHHASGPDVLCIAAREDLVIADQALRVVEI